MNMRSPSQIWDGGRCSGGRLPPRSRPAQLSIRMGWIGFAFLLVSNPGSVPSPFHLNWPNAVPSSPILFISFLQLVSCGSGSVIQLVYGSIRSFLFGILQDAMFGAGCLQWTSWYLVKIQMRLSSKKLGVAAQGTPFVLLFGSVTLHTNEISATW